MGTGTPLKNYKAIGYLSTACPDPLKSQGYQASNYQSASDMPFKMALEWRTDEMPHVLHVLQDINDLQRKKYMYNFIWLNL